MPGTFIQGVLLYCGLAVDYLASVPTFCHSGDPPEGGQESCLTILKEPQGHVVKHMS